MLVFSEDKDKIDLGKLELQEPNRLQGGASYYTKITYNGSNMYIQIPECDTRNGVIETEKKDYTDLLLSSYNEEEYMFIEWIEHLETRIKELIYEKSKLWFHNDLSKDDIDYFLNPILRTYKQKYALMRASMNLGKQGIKNKNGIVKIYNEDGAIVEVSSIKDHRIITIIEVKGLKFTTTSFHIDIELKQVMILDEEIEEETENINEFRIIRNRNIRKDTLEDNEETLEDNSESLVGSESLVDNSASVVDNTESLGKEEIKIISNNKEIKLEEVVENNETPQTYQEVQQEEETRQQEEETSQPEEETHQETLEEIEIGIPEEESDIKVNKTQDYYYELYQKALAKAKEAQKQALNTYLYAKNIKNTYLIDLVESSDEEDSDIDYETDEESILSHESL